MQYAFTKFRVRFSRVKLYNIVFMNGCIWCLSCLVRRTTICCAGHSHSINSCEVQVCTCISACYVFCTINAVAHFHFMTTLTNNNLFTSAFGQELRRKQQEWIYYLAFRQTAIWWQLCTSPVDATLYHRRPGVSGSSSSSLEQFTSRD